MLPARKLRVAHLNATSVGMFGHHSADPQDMAAARSWLAPWLAAMRAHGIVTVVTINGTGGPDGGLSHAEFSDRHIRWLILTDAPLLPRYKAGRYPTESIIAPELTAFVRQVRAAHKGFIEWGIRERAEIDTVAIQAVGGAMGTGAHRATAQGSLSRLWLQGRRYG